ncbi:glucose-6-phosphate isomerase, partial [Candidatus Woesearchaeota archaeon]|nr:glucose-6-phosphate isomerase [Candidatus Woesearchaeota archaeon]
LKHNLRYDVTIIPPGSLGEEFVKTKGHYHPNVKGTFVSYPEMYQVLEGQGVFIIQKTLLNSVIDVIMLKASKGDIILIPPNYGHVTINSGKTRLKIANWVSNSFESIYSDYEEKGGAAYYYFTNNEFVKNKKYSALPNIREKITPDFRKVFGVNDMYELIKDPKVLGFLNCPQLHPELFRFIEQ